MGAPHIIEACGPLQTCSGIEAGIEAAIHAMSKKFQEEETEGILLVDACNAFNSLNRSKGLKSVKEHCPPLFRFLKKLVQ